MRKSLIKVGMARTKNSHWAWRSLGCGDWERHSNLLAMEPMYTHMRIPVDSGFTFTHSGGRTLRKPGPTNALLSVSQSSHEDVEVARDYTALMINNLFCHVTTR